METTYEWQMIDSQSTRMTLRNRGEPTGFSRLMTPFIAWMIRRATRKDLTRLKHLLEETKGTGVTSNSKDCEKRK